MSLYALHLANGRTSNTGVFRLLGRLLSGSGVIESTGFTVSAQGTPDMTVKVSGSTASDNLVIVTSGGDTYHGWNTANANVTITANATGVTKKDHIVAYVDTALTTTTPDNPTGLVLIAVRGTGTAAPTDGEIDTATGTKPWMRLAEISVANGASSINSGNITDSRTFSQLQSNGNGWTDPHETWAYASATTITVPSDATTRYAVGDKIKYTQNSLTKLGYIVGVTSTVITVSPLVQSDLTTAAVVTNHAITANNYSKASSPIGFPGAIPYTPTQTGFSSTTPALVARFFCNGRMCTVNTHRSTNETSNATTYTISLPITAATVTNMSWGGTTYSNFDNSATVAGTGLALVSSAGTTASLFPPNASGSWTASNTKGANMVVTYQI